MRNLTIAALAALMPAGCAFETIKQGMNDLKGQPISAAIAKLAIPNDERVIRRSGKHGQRTKKRLVPSD